MKKIFVSCEDVDDTSAADFIQALRQGGAEVEHSPANPAVRNDSRWPEWYASGLAEALQRCELFVAVITSGWDSATWMAIESDQALKLRERELLLQTYHWVTPHASVNHEAKGMQPYLKNALPRPLSEAVTLLLGT